MARRKEKVSLPRESVIDERTLGDNGDVLRIVVSEYRGTYWLHIRKWWKPEDGGARRPGKGIALRVDNLPWLLQALEKAEGLVLAHGLLDEEAFETAGRAIPREILEMTPQLRTGSR